MLPIDTTFLLRIYFITSSSSVIFFKLVMSKLVVVYTQFLHIGESSIYSLFVSLLAYKQEHECPSISCQRANILSIAFVSLFCFSKRLCLS